jgi:opacity protein-like surface antigen
LKLKLILATVLAFGGMAHAQGIISNLSIGLGFEGIFPAATFTRKVTVTEGNFFSGGTQSTTTSVGAVADVRYDFGRHSAVGLALTVNRNSEIFFNNTGEVPNRVETNNGEFIGTYIFRLPANERVKPYAMFGGGVVRFSPVSGGFITSGTPQADMKAAFAYGFGTDLKVSDHWALRLQYRGLLRSAPDFKLPVSTSDTSSNFGSRLRTHVPEPSIQVVYHF